MIREILLGTPVWVYVMFAALLMLGLRQLRAAVVSTRRMMLTPVVFIVWGLLAGLLRAETSAASLGLWMLAALIGLLLGAARRNTLRIDPTRGRVLRPASALPLLRNLSIFTIHYALNVAAAFDPENHAITRFDLCLSGICTGYFIGWLIGFAQRHRGSRRTPGGLAGLTSMPGADGAS